MNETEFYLAGYQILKLKPLETNINLVEPEFVKIVKNPQEL